MFTQINESCLSSQTSTYLHTYTPFLSKKNKSRNSTQSSSKSNFNDMSPLSQISTELATINNEINVARECEIIGVLLT